MTHRRRYILRIYSRTNAIIIGGKTFDIVHFGIWDTHENRFNFDYEPNISQASLGKICKRLNSEHYLYSREIMDYCKSNEHLQA